MSNETTIGDNTTNPIPNGTFVPFAWDGKWHVSTGDRTVPDGHVGNIPYFVTDNEAEKLKKALEQERIICHQWQAAHDVAKAKVEYLTKENENLKKMQEVPATKGQVEVFQRDLDDAIYKRDQAYRDVDVCDGNIAHLTSERDYLRSLLTQMTAIAPTIVNMDQFQRPAMKKPC